MLDDELVVNSRMLEDMKLNTVSTLLALLTLGQQWASKEEFKLWRSLMDYVEYRGTSKHLGTATIDFSPEGSA